MFFYVINDYVYICNIWGRTPTHALTNKIVAADPNINAQFTSYLTITKSDDHYLFEHYTENLDLIAAIKCDLQLLIEDIYIESIPETRGLRGWWVCTRIEYNKIKAEQAEKIVCF